MTTLPPEANNEPGADGTQVPPPVPPAAPTPPQGPPQYQAPPPGAYQQQPGHQQQPGGYPQQPPQGYPQQPQPGYAQPAPTDPANTITLNYWLSVFFTWIPALIFWIIEKDKGNQKATEFHVANLNFSLIRTGVGILAAILGVIPWVGWIIGLILWLAYLVLFVFHILAAVSAPDNYRKGGKPEFLFNFPIIK